MIEIRRGAQCVSIEKEGSRNNFLPRTYLAKLQFYIERFSPYSCFIFFSATVKKILNILNKRQLWYCFQIAFESETKVERKWSLRSEVGTWLKNVLFLKSITFSAPKALFGIKRAIFLKVAIYKNYFYLMRLISFENKCVKIEPIYHFNSEEFYRIL